MIHEQKVQGQLEENVRRLFGRLESGGPTSDATRDRILDRLLQEASLPRSTRAGRGGRRWVRWASLAAALFVAAALLTTDLDEPGESRGRGSVTTESSAEATLVTARAADATVGDDATRRDDLERGIDLYKQIDSRVSNGEKDEVRRKWIELNVKSAGLAGDTDEGKKERARYLLDAMDVAAESNDPTLAKEALRGPFVVFSELAFAPETDEMKRGKDLQARLEEIERKAG